MTVAFAGQIDVVASRDAVQEVHADELGDITRAGSGGDVGERSRLHDLAVFEDDEPVSERGGVERIVGHEQADAGERREMGAELAPHRAAGALVERGERLVEQQQAGFGDAVRGRARPAGPDRPESSLGLHLRAIGEPDLFERRRRPARRAAARLMPRLRSPNATFSSTLRCGKSR